MWLTRLFKRLKPARNLDGRGHETTPARRSASSGLVMADVRRPPRDLVIADIGCRWGCASPFIAKDSGFMVLGFEADPEECERLNRAYAGLPVFIFPVALSGRKGPRTLHVTREPACSSLIPPDVSLTGVYPALACADPVRSVLLETVTLDEWRRDNEVPLIDYLKIDTQGSELEILQGAVATLQSVRCLEVEVEFNPIYVGQPLFADVDQFLRREGFVLWKLTNQVHYSREGNPEEALGEDIICYDDRQQIRHSLFGGQLYWANAHYVKKSIVDGAPASAGQDMLDIRLFESLRMPDVTACLRARRDGTGAAR